MKISKQETTLLICNLLQDATPGRELPSIDPSGGNVDAIEDIDKIVQKLERAKVLLLSLNEAEE